MGAGLLASGALGLAGMTFLRPPAPRPLEELASQAVKPPPKLSRPELEAFAHKPMSRVITKAALPPPPKPVVPPLDLVIRLSGIIDYGTGSPREAFIEIRSTSQTKAYKLGDSVPNVGAVVKSISDAVVLEYDGQLWKLTDRGVQALPNDPITTTTGAKP
jgi:type II secretory pathway component PulC